MAALSIIAAIIAIVCGASNASPVKFVDCGSKVGIPLVVDVTPCDQYPCQLPLNADVTIKVLFESKLATDSVDLFMTAIISDIPMELPLPDTDACTMGVHCPVQPGDNNTMAFTVNIEYDFPVMPGIIIKLELQKDYQDLVCAQFEVAIVEGDKEEQEEQAIIDGEQEQEEQQQEEEQEHAIVEGEQGREQEQEQEPEGQEGQENEYQQEHAEQQEENEEQEQEEQAILEGEEEDEQKEQEGIRDLLQNVADKQEKEEEDTVLRFQPRQ